MKKNIIFLILTLVIAFHIVNNYIWLKLDCLFIYPKMITNTVFHLENQVMFYRAMESLFTSDSSFLEKVNSFILLFKAGQIWPQHVYPGFAYFITSIVNLLFGLTPFITRLSNLLFLIILIIFTYLIGKNCENAKAGLFAGFLISFYPALLGISRLYDLDFHLITMVTVNIYFLIKSNKFSNMKYSLLLGIFSGFGILTKGQFLIFIIGPLLYILYNIAKDVIYVKRRDSLAFVNYNLRITDLYKQIVNFIVFLAVSLIISSIWWRGDLKTLSNVFFTHFLVGYLPEKYDLFGLRYDVFTMGSIFYHLCYLIDHISIYLYLVFCISLFWIRRKVNSNIQIILSWVLVPLFIFTFMSAKWEHYCFSILPAVAILTAIGIERFNRKIKFPIVLFLLIFTFLQFFIISYGFKSDFIGRAFFYNVTPEAWGINIYKVPFKINNYEEVIREFADKINNAENKGSFVANTKKKELNLGVIDITEAEINDVLIAYYMKIYTTANNINIIGMPNGVSTVPNPSMVAERFAEKINDLDFIVVINNNPLQYIDVNNLEIPRELLSISSYQRIINNIKRKAIIDRKTLMPDRKSIFLLGKT